MADIGLPGMSGDVFAAQARTIRPMLGIVFATGSDRVRVVPVDEGGAVLLRKPYETEALEGASQKALPRTTG